MFRGSVSVSDQWPATVRSQRARGRPRRRLVVTRRWVSAGSKAVGLNLMQSGADATFRICCHRCEKETLTCLAMLSILMLNEQSETEERGRRGKAEMGKRWCLKNKWVEKGEDFFLGGVGG